ncbi:MAG: AAA family ATPase, partial [Leptospiraceae bacterium]|nr:AAA family ATPase [Leptospiraceae bacterium]
MILEEIRLKNFRNYENIIYKFTPGLIFIIGENGKGKTNLIEAIGFFSYAKSFRNNKEIELIKWGEKYFHISGSFKEKKNIKIEIGYEKEPITKRKIKIDGVLVKKRSELIGEIFSVIFSPSDIRIIEDGPVERRRYVDSFISMADKFYMQSLLEYNKILKQRNALLRQKE